MIGLQMGQDNETIKKLISEIDVDGDSKINFHEF
jgi:Ca2+-binding EF-hand superfamily protein